MPKKTSRTSSDQKLPSEQLKIYRPARKPANKTPGADVYEPVQETEELPEDE